MVRESKQALHIGITTCNLYVGLCFAFLLLHAQRMLPLVPREAVLYANSQQ